MAKITSRDENLCDSLLREYESKKHLVAQFQHQLVGAFQDAPELTPHIHSLKSRLKHPNHLRDKLHRKILHCKQNKLNFDITPDNLLVRVTDLVGVRLLHLHTRQMQVIDACLRGILEEQQYALLEGPFARTWDDESRAFFADCGIDTQESPSMYTSVHYIVGSASRTRITGEIQVRTLMEEVWGEVDHAINYPHETTSLACREQIKVLARVTSSATRLVDSIFATHDDQGRPETPENKPAVRPESKSARSKPRKSK